MKLFAVVVLIPFVFSLPVPHLQDAQLNFLSVGDWGHTGARQSRVAEFMARSAADLKAEFIISTGDNFYPLGIHSADDQQFNSTFESVFSAASLQVPWYVIAGNHDHYGFVDFEIEYSKKSARWNFPALYHDKVMVIDPATNTTVHFVFIDTVELEHLRPHRKQQLDWIESTLKSSKSEWVIVVGHFPVYSGGEHGSQKELIEDLNPLLEKYKVAAYIDGHDHTLQHLSAGGIDYFVSGGGTYQGSIQKISQTIFAQAIGGFMTHQLSNDVMTTQVIDEYGNTLHTATTHRVARF